MNCSPNFTEWTREEKEEFAKRRMVEMKLKNEKLLQRHAEVENDRISAESRNSAVTGTAKAAKKEKNVTTHEYHKEENRTEHAREWDRGKPDKDHWKSPEHHASSFKNYRSSGRFERKDNDRKDNWGSYSRNENTDRTRRNRGTEDTYEKRNADRRETWSGYSRNESNDRYRHDYSSDVRKLRGNYRYKQNDNNQHSSSRLQVSPKRTRGIGYRSNDSHRKSQSSYSDDKYKKSDYKRSNSRKKYSYRAHSRSSSRSGSDYVENQFTIRAYNLWQNDKISEDQTKQNRVERWVKSVNKTNMWGDKQLSPDKQFSPDQKDKNASKSYSKFDRFEHSPDKSTDEEEYATNFNTSGGNKTRESSNYTSQRRDYNEGKYQNKGSSHSAKFGGYPKKSFQTKRSPQYSSAGSSKNENFRKQRRFDSKGYKNDDDKNKYKPKMYDNPDDRWKNSDIAYDNPDDRWKNSEIAYNNPDDGWKNSENAYDNPDDRWKNSEIVYDNPDDIWKNSDLDNAGDKSRERRPNLDDANTWNEGDGGLWENAEQSDIKWKLSDEEIDLKETNQNRKHTKKNIDMSDSWNYTPVTKVANKGKFTVKDKNENKKQVQYDDDGIWSGVDQSDVHWKSDSETYTQECKNQNVESSNSKNKSAIKHTTQRAKTDPGDGWEDYGYQGGSQGNVRGFSAGKDEKYKTSGQQMSSNGANDANITECHSSSATRPQQNSDALSQKSHSEDNSATYSADTIISSFKRSMCISDEKSTNLSIDHFSEKPVGSDDGGWSTVSEEGEIHSDEEDANKNKKLYKKM